MARVVVVGGGWAGCAAALAARKAGAEVILLERTDQLLGTGLVGGIMRNNGRFTAAEEMIALGGGELFRVTDAVARHQGVEFPGHHHATLYDVARVEPRVRRLLGEMGVEVYLRHRVTDVQVEGNRLQVVDAAAPDGKGRWEADAFVDATGSAGPQGNCTRYGNGCCMCILRCPSFGPRVSLAGRAGAREKMSRTRTGQVGAMSGSCKILKESLSPELQTQLNREGVAVVALPVELRKADLSKKACQQYALPDFAENLVLLDTGHAKLMTSYFPLAALRSVPGLETARYEDPYAAGLGNSIRYLAMSPHDETLRVEGFANLFCGGEKVGPLVGHTEAICTGTLAGWNAARQAQGLSLLVLPPTLAVGDAISAVTRLMRGPEEELTEKYTFSGSVYFQRMKDLGFYTTDVGAIARRVQETGLEGVFAGARGWARITANKMTTNKIMSKEVAHDRTA
ncbi:MAG TPA: FAD-dependent oxidoreductase [Firmicutes bacterium]|nr:FAD-dependent oxidoreductase [Bacillota bacterium]